MTPVAVMAKPAGCPGACVYCPDFPDTPKSYTPESPAVLRAKACNYDPKKQVELRLNTLSAMGHPADKVELIVMGGTFLACPEDYQYWFVKSCYDALNGCDSPTLEDAKKMNETAKHRCVGMCIETRPDWCGDEDVRRMLQFGATRVELGVQTLDDGIFRLVRRGHTVDDVIKATKRLKDYGFKVYYHWMPGLPGSTPEHDLRLTEALFDNPDFKPDGLKLYPTLVISGTELERWYRDDRYRPYSMEELTELMMGIKAAVPAYVRIARVMRDIPDRYIVAGCKDLALRSSLKRRMAEVGLRCHCIRCREYGHRTRDGWRAGEPELIRQDYTASDGREVFLSFEDSEGTLFALLRMRVSQRLMDWNGTAMVRELHVFGTEVPLGSQTKTAVQHRGMGKRLLQEAENIARLEFGASRIAVISGVGAREYFRSELGYQLDGAYMVKKLVAQVPAQTGVSAS